MHLNTAIAATVTIITLRSAFPKIGVIMLPILNSTDFHFKIKISLKIQSTNSAFISLHSKWMMVLFK